MDEIINLTQDLVRFKTMHSQPDEIKRCASFIEAYLKKCGAYYQRLDHGNIPSLIVMPQNNVAPILLMSHIDVVDGSDDLPWPCPWCW
jgi:succinyl-diaminopimelate desuccinylase